MYSLSGWLHIIVILCAVGALSGAIVAGGLRRLLNPYLAQIEPNGRYWLIAILLLLPFMLSITMLWVAFYPSFFDLAGLVSDHCGVHCHQSFHLCFVHFSSPHLGWYWSVLVVSLFVIGLNTIRREFQGLWYTRKWFQRLLSLANYDTHTNTYSVTGGHIFAITGGLIRPRIVHSEELQKILSPIQFEAVLVHERTHKKRWDALIKFVLRLCSHLHFAKVRYQLLKDLDIVCEQICDEAAAQHVGDRLSVAEAILAVERLKKKRGVQVPGAVLSFGEINVEQRIESLLNGQWHRVRLQRIALCVGIITAVILFNMHDFHHALEHVLGWYFSLR